MLLKLLLCYKLVVLILDELVNGEFQYLIGDVNVDVKKVKCVVLCLGKVYYDLLEDQVKCGQDDVVIICVEQLYLFLCVLLVVELKKYGKVIDVVWMQEELQNQGVWYQICYYLQFCLVDGQNLYYVGCVCLVLLVVGYMVDYVCEQQQLIVDVLVNLFNDMFVE